MNQTITCPKCGAAMELSEALKRQLGDEVRQEYERRLMDQRSKIEEELRARLNPQLASLQKQLSDAQSKVRTSEQRELGLLRRQKELEEKQHSIDLEIERRLAEERNAVRVKAREQAEEEHRLRDADKDRVLDDMKKQITDLKRKLEQGSQQLQGEVMEVELEHLLAGAFRFDRIEPVPAGIRGADVVQRVYTQSGSFCGTILWESKRTKNWSDAWLQKLKDDLRDMKADVAVIVSEVLPKDTGCITNLEGVWVTDFRTAVGLAAALRSGLMQLAYAKQALVGKSDKMEMLYRYLSGKEFRQRIEAMVESFSAMKEDLDAERRSMERIWSKREKQIERLVLSTAGIYGDLQGIVGAALEPIPNLELPAQGIQNDSFE